jgi:glutamine synthetase
VEALAVLTREEIVSLFDAHKVLSREELESRYHIYLERYSRQLNIEAGITIEMARRQIFPSASAYAAELARNAAALNVIQAVSTAQEERAREIANLAWELDRETGRLNDLLGSVQEMEDLFSQARAYSEKIRPAMDNVRLKADALEKLTAKAAWPFPGYEELLFKL